MENANNRGLDEYQKIKRYRNGYWTMIGLVFALILSSSSSEGWAESSQVEMLLLAVSSVAVFHLTNVFTHSYFGRKEQGIWQPISSFLVGLLWLGIVWIDTKKGNNPLIINGKLGLAVSNVVFAIMWLGTPVMMGLRTLWERYNENEE